MWDGGRRRCPSCSREREIRRRTSSETQIHHSRTDRDRHADMTRVAGEVYKTFALSGSLKGDQGDRKSQDGRGTPEITDIEVSKLLVLGINTDGWTLRGTWNPKEKN